jgi:hypothetical protein
MSRANPRFRRVSAPLPAVGSTNGIVLYRIWGSIEGQLTITTFYYVSAVPSPTNAQLLTLLANVSGGFFAGYAACISADWTCTKETMDVVHRNDIAGVTSIVHATFPGTRPAGHEPTEVATIVIRYSAVKGQHGRGRIGLPAPATADITASRITAAAMITNLNTLATNMLLGFSDGANTWFQTAIQRATASPKLVIGFSMLTKITPNTLLGTIRRRRIGRGK